MSRSISEVTILDMIEEGKNNFISSRFSDAANLFRSVVRNLEKHDYDSDSVYFSYARIVALGKAHQIEQEIQAYNELGNRCLQLALKKAIEQQKIEKNPMEKSVYMNLAQKTMKLLGMQDERESIVLSLVQLYKSLVNDINTAADVQELLQERIVEFCGEFDHPNLSEETQKLALAQLLENAADFLMNSEKLHVDVIAANKYIKAAAILLQYKKEKEMKDLLRKALKCSKHGQFQKFGFTRIARPPHAKTEDGKEIDPDPDMSDNTINIYLTQIVNALPTEAD